MPAASTAAPLVLAGLALYLIAVAVTGLLARRRSAGEAGFYLAGRALGPLTATSSLAATVVGGSALILVAGQVFARGLPGVWIDLAGGIGLIILGLLLAGRVRGMGLFSLPEIAGRFYGRAVRTVAAALVLLAEIAWLGLLLKACAAVLRPLLGAGELPLLLLVGGVFTLYTAVGGQLAVARTDVVQLALMAAGILMVAAPILIGAADWAAVPQRLLRFPAGPGFPPRTLLPLILVTALPHLVGSDIYGKLLSCRDEGIARRAALAAGGLKILFGLAAAAIGLAAVSMLPPDTPADQVLTRLVLTALPEPAAALVVIALLATLMSSVDSVLLTAATVLSRDLLRRPGAATGRSATVAIGALGILIAAAFATLLDIFMFAYTLFSAGLALPLLFGFWRARLRLNTAGAAASMVGGAAVVLAGTAAGWPPELVTSGGLAASCVLLFAVSLIGRRAEG